MTAERPPWMVPVPIRPSKFKALRPSDARFNVEVDLSAIQTFTRGKCIPERELVYSDLQTNADTNIDQRLGSGRAGFYRGRYLKGIGRTQLAGNWNMPGEAYHNSGLLYASSAVREYLVSELLRAHRASHLIVPCSGLLLRSLPASFRTHQKETFRGNLRVAGRKFELPRVDAHAQAITVKDGVFARFSNFAWWLCHFPQFRPGAHRSNIARFFTLLSEQLGQGGARSKNEVGDLDAENIASRLSAALTRSIEYFMDAWALGINWGSLHNNFTMDGRFLDLETPTVYRGTMWGSPFNLFDAQGELPKEFELSAPDGTFVGFNVTSLVLQLQRFVLFLESRLRYFKDSALVGQLEAQFIEQFLDALRTELSAPHILGSQAALSAYVVGRMARTLDLDSSETRLIAERFNWLSQELPFKHRGRKPRPPRPLKLYLAGGESLARTEPASQVVTYIPGFMVERSARTDPKNAAFNTWVTKIDSCKDIDQVFEFADSATASFFGAK